MNGYHTYYKFENEFRKSHQEFEAIDVLAQLTSILFWKKNYGSIKLYCNTDHLDLIRKYGIDCEYDSIDTDLLNSMPYKDKASRYWSFSKIHAAKEISKYDKEFCIIDTDLWIKEPNLISTDSDFSLYHEEHFDPNVGFNNYHDPINWMDETKEYDWTCWPMNCAIMYFKNRTTELIGAWYNEVTKVILLDKNPDNLKNKLNSAIFIEQRLLPTIANRIGLKYDSIKPNAFLVRTFKENIEWNKKWQPFLNSSDESLKIEHSIIHLWGKRMRYNEDWIRKNVLKQILRDLEQFPGIREKYKQLFNECYELSN